MNDDATVFGARLRACRYAAGLSREALAERSGLGVRAISDMDRGRTRRPHPDSVRRLADALELRGQARAEFFGTLAAGAVDATPFQASLAHRDAGAGLPRQLPGPVRVFVGRNAELAALTGLLDSADSTPAPVVISAIGGTAGVGKTALAVRWAHRVADRFPDGQLYVNLCGYDPGQPLAAADALAGFLRDLGVPGPDVPAEAGERAAPGRTARCRAHLHPLPGHPDPQGPR